jgi:hypothetical protein
LHEEVNSLFCPVIQKDIVIDGILDDIIHAGDCVGPRCMAWQRGEDEMREAHDQYDRGFCSLTASSLFCRVAER